MTVLLDAMVWSPLVGVKMGATDGRLHRVDMRGANVRAWGHASTVTAACGAVVKLLGDPPARWDKARTRGTSWKRCPDCKAHTKAED
jgi:hypothetical protein